MAKLCEKCFVAHADGCPCPTCDKKTDFNPNFTPSQFIKSTDMDAAYDTLHGALKDAMETITSLRTEFANSQEEVERLENLSQSVMKERGETFDRLLTRAEAAEAEVLLLQKVANEDQLEINELNAKVKELGEELIRCKSFRNGVQYELSQSKLESIRYREALEKVSCMAAHGHEPNLTTGKLEMYKNLGFILEAAEQALTKTTKPDKEE